MLYALDDHPHCIWTLSTCAVIRHVCKLGHQVGLHYRLTPNKINIIESPNF